MPQAPVRRSTRESSDVASLVRLHHRRRGWAWVATDSVIALVVYMGLDVNLFENLTGTAETPQHYPGLRPPTTSSRSRSPRKRRSSPWARWALTIAPEGADG